MRFVNLIQRAIAPVVVAHILLNRGIFAVGENKDCSSFDENNPPFPGAVCHDIVKPDGTKSVIYLNGVDIGATTNNFHAATDGMNPKVHSLRDSIRVKNLNKGNDDGVIPSKWSFQPSTPQAFCDTENTIFSGKSSNGYAPDVNDCLAILNWARDNYGYWVVSEAEMAAHKWTALAVVDSCAFVVKTAEEDRYPWGLAFGNDDVKELIERAEVKNRIGKALESYGMTKCYTYKTEEVWTQVPTEWYIVNPEMVDIGQGEQ